MKHFITLFFCLFILVSAGTVAETKQILQLGGLSSSIALINNDRNILVNTDGQLVQYDVSNGSQRILHSFLHPLGYIFVSPDGSRIGGKCNNSELFIMSPDGSEIFKDTIKVFGGVVKYEFSEDGDYIYYSTNDSIRRYNVNERSIDNDFIIPRTYISDFRGSRGILANSVGKAIYIRDMANKNKLLHEFNTEFTPSRIVLNDDCNQVAIANSNDSLVGIYDVKSGNCLRILKGAFKDYFQYMTFSPDNKMLAVLDYKNLNIWKLETGELYICYTLDFALTFFSSPIFSKDNKSLYVVDEKSSLRKFDLPSKETKLLSHTITSYEYTENTINVRYQYDADGNKIFVTNDDMVGIFDANDGSLLKNYYGYEHYQSHSEYNYDGSLIISTGPNNFIGVTYLRYIIKVWNEKTGELLRTIKTNDSKKFVVSPYSNIAASIDENFNLHVVDLVTGQTLLNTRLSEYNTSFTFEFMPDGRHVIYKNPYGITILGIENNSIYKKLNFNFAIEDFTVSKDGKTLVVSYAEGQIHLAAYDLETGELKKVISDKGSANPMFNMKGDVLAYINNDKSIIFLSYPGLEQIRAFTPYTITSNMEFMFLPDNNSIYCSQVVSDYSPYKYNYPIQYNYRTDSSIISSIPYKARIKPDLKKYIMTLEDLIYSINIDTTSHPNIFKRKINPYTKTLCWSKDKSKILYQPKDNLLYILDASNGSIIDSMTILSGIISITHDTTLSEFVIIFWGTSCYYWKPADKTFQNLFTDDDKYTRELLDASMSPNKKMLIIADSNGLRVRKDYWTKGGRFNISLSGNNAIDWVNDSSSFICSEGNKMYFFDIDEDLNIIMKDSIISRDKIYCAAYNRKKHLLAFSTNMFTPDIDTYYQTFLYDMKKSKPYFPIIAPVPGKDIKFSNDGGQMFLESNNKYWVYDCNSLKLLNMPVLNRIDIFATATSLDGRHTLCVYRDSVAEIKTNPEYNVDKILGLPKTGSMCLGSESNSLYSVSTPGSSNIRIYDYITGSFLRNVPTINMYFQDNRLMLSPDESKLINAVTSYIYWVYTDNGFYRIIPDHEIFCFTNDSKNVIGYSGKDLKMWDCENGRELLSLPADSISRKTCNIALSPDDKLIACAISGRIYLWNLQEKRFEKEIDVISQYRIDNMIFDNTGTRIICLATYYSTGDFFIFIIDVDKEIVLEEVKTNYFNPKLNIRKDGKYLLSPGIFYGIRVWELDPAVSVDDNTNPDNIEANGFIYPNPAGSNVKIHLMESVSPGAKVWLYGINGMEICSDCVYEYHGQENSIEMDVSGISAGIYLVRISDNGKVKVFRMIKE